MAAVTTTKCAAVLFSERNLSLGNTGDFASSVSLEDFCSLQKRTIPSHRRSPRGNGSHGWILFTMWMQLVRLSFSCPPHRGKEFIINHLRMQDVSCYWEKLLTEYSRLLTYKPKRRKNYNEVVHRPTKTELWGGGMLRRMMAAVLNRDFHQ